MFLNKKILLPTVLLTLTLACTSTSDTSKTQTPPTPTGGISKNKNGVPSYTGKLPLDKLKLPPGYKIHVFAEGVKNARAMCLSPGGTVFVGSREAGNVYALRDTDGDHVVDQKFTIASKLNMPVGVAFRDGSLYVSAVSKILKFENIENQLSTPPAPVVVYDKFPTDEHHGWKYIAFGPDGKLYVPVGAPCNICEPENPIYCTITRLNPDGTGMEIVQSGIRNTVGFTWRPGSGELWFTDNGRDWLGDDSPACELNRATKDGMHFGYPYCHQGDVSDPKFGEKRPCSDFTPPAQNLGPHVAPLGLEFVTSPVFPTSVRNQILIAEHGSWNRSNKIGYRIALVTLEGDRCTSYKPFIEGWLQPGDEVWGRPVDLEWLPDGSLLISDDHADAIYRVVYTGN